MSGKDRLVRCGVMPGGLSLHYHPAARPRLAAAAVAAAVALAVAAPAMGQPDSRRRGLGSSIRAADLVVMGQRCGAADPLEESFELIGQRACSGRRSDGKILAFEEGRLFIYALADISAVRAAEDGGPSQQATQRLRRFFLLKPSTFVVQDLVRAKGEDRPIRWSLRSSAEPKIDDGRFRVAEGDAQILGESLLPAGAEVKKTSRPGSGDRPARFRVEVTPPQASDETRFLQVFHLHGTTGQRSAARSKVEKGDRQVELTVTTHQRVFRLTLPSDSSQAGQIEVSGADGKPLLRRRLLPSGVMPHGPAGARLLERWDSPYRQERLPGWDVGRPCSHLVKAVEDETFRPGRAIVLGCGSGTNAIYLAGKGFEVTGVDVAPSALAIAQQKARKAGVTVRWLVADAVALPELEAFDLVFDRGCYHHICQYDSPGYVDALRRLSRGGTRALILAGSPADGRSGGPPRVKEETIRNDFSTLFDFQWLRDVRFDSRNPDAKGPSAWSIHLRRKDQ